jgi:glycosyltransferase involved in cell wall biosynthesis
MDNVDVVHWTYPLPLYVPGARNIYTIHDVVPLKFPEMVRNAEEFATLCRDVASHADQIWTVSETSRADIIELLGLDAAIVFNSYQPVDLAAADAERDDVLAMHGLRAGGYFLFYGAIEPKKNVLRLLDAHARARVDTPLVVVGKAGWQCDEEMRRLKAGVVGEGPAGRPRLLWLDYLPRAQLLHLVAKAKAVLFPSLYEGFGLPMLEAMTLGTPVLGSTGGSLPEVAGDAALLVDPLSVEALSKAIHRLDGDAVLRARLAHDGPKRALVFSADRYRERVGALLQILQGATIPLRDPPVRR